MRAGLRKQKKLRGIKARYAKHKGLLPSEYHFWKRHDFKNFVDTMNVELFSGKPLMYSAKDLEKL